MPSPALRLVTIGPSHYCEKARWALDRAGLPYREDAHLPVFHIPAARRASGGRQTHVPILVTPDGPLTDSTDILRWLDDRLPPERRLFPADLPDAAALEDDFDEHLGKAARVVAYGALLPDLGRFVADFTRGVPARERWLFRPALPLGRAAIRRAYRVTPAHVARSRDQVARDFDAVAARLADDRPYLCGDRFSAADLTFASLAGPLVNLDRQGPLLRPDRLTPALTSLIAGYAAHPAGAFIARLYREDRHR